MNCTQPKNVTKHILRVGLKDKDTKEHKQDPAKIAQTVQTVFSEYDVGFSASLDKGGYLHEDGTYVFETSLSITICDAPTETVMAIAEAFCKAFNQESVLVEKEIIMETMIFSD